MKLTEEFVLLMLNEQSGFLETIPPWEFSCVMSGAVIADLALEYRIDTDLNSLVVTDASPTGDDLLDPTLSDIVAEGEIHNARYWIERIAGRADEIVNTTLDRLVDVGILDYDNGGFWSLSSSVSSTKMYPTEEGKRRAEVRTRILTTIFEDVLPDPRDVILINLMHVCDGFRLLLSSDDYAEKKERIELLAGMDLIGQSLYKAVQESSVAPKFEQALQTKPIPKFKLRDLIRSKALRETNLPKFMAELYTKYGPVIESPRKFQNHRFLLLIGPEINKWVNKQGRFHLRTKDYIQGLEEAFGAARTLPGMDGAEHFRMRKSLRYAYSRAALADRLDELYVKTRESFAQLQQNDVITATDYCIKMMSNQLARLAMNIEDPGYIQDILDYKNRAIQVYVQHGLPKFMLKTPRMKRARHQIGDLIQSIQSSHTVAQRDGKPVDLGDLLLKLHKEDPQFFPETDMDFPFAASMVASIYMGSGFAFAIYALLTNPEIETRIYEEAEALFGGGKVPSQEDITMDAIDVTHRFAMECERMYPVIPIQMRHVMNPCVIEGYEVSAGTRLLIAQTAVHYMSEVYKDPLKFDIERFNSERSEHTQAGAYAPYGLGTHTCLGHRWVELQMVMNLLLLTYHFKLELVPEDYKLSIHPMPNAKPRRNMRVKVTEIRNPISA